MSSLAPEELISIVTLIQKTAKQAWTPQNAAAKITVENQGIRQSTDGFDIEVFDKHSGSGGGVRFNPKLSREESAGFTPSDGDLRTEPIDALFITTKAHSTAPALSHLAPRLTSRSTVVLLQNGMGLYEDLVQRIFRNPESRPHFILASNTHGAWLKSAFHVVHAGIGDITFGIVPDSRKRDFETSMADESKPLYERSLVLDDITHPDDPSFDQYRSLRHTVAVLRSLDALGCKWSPITEVQLAMRKKLVVNAIVNPLTAVLGCRNGGLFKDESSQNMMRSVCEEAAAAFCAQIEADTQSWLDSLAPSWGRVPKELGADALEREVLRVTHVTRGNMSSMLSDIRKNNPTEIDFLNGYLVRLGEQYNIPMPVNRALVQLVKMRCSIPIDQTF
ncbi:ketopantoate reductase PanE/ApbA C terminal-domain-containing protein [Suillus subalutaceus]|uniref:ketopantoate reductase PanE/ApbA C terminal-domain-containing protein n=1 Tax=Suillus subalutaceus TaxID=48586 RepID=UPI001B86A526|nr:ketopantoate reductase PanE/ApbA C terminal-domain-containing protein [Suillus subalutaceus]KAG1864730.1 ketopantoate reductase PanE/ApbA C terminal-domain-containing protein [Suillus subalutaceus]